MFKPRTSNNSMLAATGKDSPSPVVTARKTTPNSSKACKQQSSTMAAGDESIQLTAAGPGPCELLAYELEYAHFGFSPAGLCDQVHNAIVDTWDKLVNAKLSDPQFIAEFPDFKQEEFRRWLASLIVKVNRGYLEKRTNQMKELATNLMRVPECVTLPPFELARKREQEWEESGELFNELQAEATCRELENEIVKLRYDIAYLDADIQENEQGANVLSSLVQKLDERLKEQQLEKGNASSVQKLTASTHSLSLLDNGEVTNDEIKENGLHREEEMSE